MGLQKWERLQSLRKERGLTQAELALRLGINRSSLANYESGIREPDFEGTQKFADFFGVTIDYLLGRSEESQPIPFKPEWKRMIAEAEAKGYEPDQVLKALELLESLRAQLSREHKEERER